jgi:N-acetylglutamate synthase-like GNAT family acetyltransferase
MSFQIRRAKLKDADKIYEIGSNMKELNFSNKFKFHQKDEIIEFVKKPKDNIFLVALIDEKIVGFLYAKILAYGQWGWCMLDNLAVEKKFRGEGIASMFLKELYKIMKKRKVHYVHILEDVHRKKTKKFWHDRGFKEERIFVWADKIIR